MRGGVQVSSRRALRVDPAFDKIIQTFYPDFDAYKKKEKQYISSGIAESHRIAAAIEEGWRCQVRTNAHSALSLVSPCRGLVSSRRGLVCARLTARVIPSAQFLRGTFVFLCPFPCRISRAVCVSVC